MKSVLKSILSYFGYVAYKKKPKGYIANIDHRRRMLLLNSLQIDLIFDIGANDGIYVNEMRKLGYTNKVVSFEPLSNSYQALKLISELDENWYTCNYGLGNKEELKKINISENSVSSSILTILPSHLESSHSSKVISEEIISLKTLDSVFEHFSTFSDSKIWLKIDTQGYEKFVLDGGMKSLAKISVVQLEMSLVPLYENEMLYDDMIIYMNSLGFILFSIENGFYSKKTGQLLQIEGIFVKSDLMDTL